MNIMALVLLAVILGAQLIISKTKFAGKRNGFWIFGLFVLAVFGFQIYFSWKQYGIWKNDEMGKFLLPPHQDFDYFVFYVRSRFFNPYLLSLSFGALFFWAAKYLNKKYDGRFFEPIEPYLLGASMFAVGHPMWLFYFIILIILYFIINSLFTIHNSLFKKGEMPRISLYCVWLPAAIFTILISKWISLLPWWQILKF